MTGLISAACATGFTFLMTALGAAMVLFMYSDDFSDKVRRAFLGFAAGVMIAASVWSLLIPAIEESEKLGKRGWIPAAGGFACGVAFLMILDKILPCFNKEKERRKGRTAMLVFAITLHNIPEGMAVGLAFAVAARSADPALFGAAVALAVGMGIQNFPEGAAIAIPLRQHGMGRLKAFLCGAASGIVEPVFGVLTVLVAGAAQTVLPWFLSFAAGAMLYVVADELIPEAHLEGSRAGTICVMIGFILMMTLDVAL
ncbi:MAG: ZIP family metal transporter [Ruminococcus sp.]|uniref:ZIP family metal transporter n=1 Tax=Ruminococcus sp. TaxID=41978 RepID=UPI0025F3BCAC|nr:ZIP family metal transporter [Ruminococcus sp.]MBO4867726.1 ZIP family metal transporter [Ruminococcus sp.]